MFWEGESLVSGGGVRAATRGSGGAMELLVGAGGRSIAVDSQARDGNGVSTERRSISGLHGR